MSTEDLIRKGWRFAPYWVEGPNDPGGRTGKGEATHFAAFFSGASADNPSLDAICVGKTMKAVVETAGRIAERFEKMRGLFPDDVKVEVVDKGLVVYLIAADEEARGGDAQKTDIEQVYVLNEYDGGDSLPAPLSDDLLKTDPSPSPKLGALTVGVGGGGKVEQLIRVHMTAFDEAKKKRKPEDE